MSDLAYKEDVHSKIATLQSPEDWDFFRTVYKYIGTFYEIRDEENITRTVYLDENAARILRMKYDDVRGGIPYDKFMNWIMSHSETPFHPQQHVYDYRVGAERFYIKLYQRETPTGSMGFIQNLTDLQTEQQAASVFLGTDAVTGLLTRDAVIQTVHEIAREDHRGCLAVIHINGIENLNHWYGYNYSDRGLITAAKTLLRFKTDSILIGVKSFKEFLIYFRDMDSSHIYQILTDICKAMETSVVTDDFGAMIVNGQNLLSASVGYCTYNQNTDGTLDMRELLNKASFALMEARADRFSQIHPYTEESYQKDRERYGDVLNFMRLMNDNLFDYYFQPIVEVRTGNIFAYEMLMRTQDGISMSPERILDIASEKNQLYDIEHATIFNALRIIEEHAELFRDKKLFVNSIPGHILTNEHYEELRNSYGKLLENIIIEFTEQTEISDENLATIQRRCRESNMGLAIDDYGTGYSNVSSLLRYAPNYVKIDRSLLTQIQIDPKKQHLVSSIITFAHKNGIMVLAEGVETPLELKSVIQLGADLIQGYYTARPDNKFLPEIVDYVRKEISRFYSEFEESRQSDIYNVTNEAEIHLADIDTKVYKELLINENDIRIDGSDCTFVNLALRTKPNCNCHVELYNIRLKRTENSPCIILGENSTLTLDIIGRNYINGTSGIMVPSNSKLTIQGDGNLFISCDGSNCFGIGSDATHSYGNITIDMAGQLSVYVNGESAAGIGGGHNANMAAISIHNTELEVTTTGIACTSIGCLYGGADIRLCNCDVSINSHATNLCTIGGKQQSTEIVIDDSSLVIVGSGDILTGIGSENSGYGSIQINHSTISMSMNARDVACIGTRDGDIGIASLHSRIRLNCEATVASGLGDAEGKGDLSMRQTTLNLNLSADEVYEIGSPHGTLSLLEGYKIQRKDVTTSEL